MRRMRIVLIIVGVILAVAAIGGGAAFYFTSGAVEAADGFLKAIATQGPEAAYAQAAPAFRASTPAAFFAQEAERMHLRSFTSASWSSRSISGGTADLEGTLSLGDAGTVPATIRLVHNDDGAWRVLEVRIAQAGLQSSNVTAPKAVPPEDKTKQLAQVTMMQLAEAIRAKDFRGLQAAGSSEFRAQITPEALAQQFKTFTDHNLDLTKDETKPVSFTKPPAFDANGQLVLTGMLQGQVQPWYFEFGYIDEAGDWRLTSVSLSSHPG